jgi:hypothetical protein
MSRRSIRLPLLGLFALASSAVASPDTDLLPDATLRMAQANGFELTYNPIADAGRGSFASVTGGDIRLTRSAAGLARTPKEASAMVAMVLAYSGKSFPVLGERRPGTAEYVISYSLFAIADNARHGGGAGLPDARDVPNFTREELREQERKIGQKRAAYAIHLANTAGSCMGPMIDLLNRMRSVSGGAAASDGEPSGFARMVLHDLGAQAYPPDRGCE